MAVNSARDSISEIQSELAHSHQEAEEAKAKFEKEEAKASVEEQKYQAYMQKQSESCFLVVLLSIFFEKIGIVCVHVSHAWLTNQFCNSLIYVHAYSHV